MVDRAENRELFEKTVILLSGVLQKSEREISLMLKRHSLQDKKKKKKGDLDRKKATVSQLLEKDLREANTPKDVGENNFLGRLGISILDLQPGKFTF